MENYKMQRLKATAEDLIFTAKNLSSGDLREFDLLQSGRDPLAVFPKYLDETTYSIKLNEVVLAVGGHAQGAIWFVTTNVIDNISKADRICFYRILKKHLVCIKEEQVGVVLTNVVSINNHAHLRLLESLGATFNTLRLLSPAGFEFCQFWL
jgi:hypothetical protein